MVSNKVLNTHCVLIAGLSGTGKTASLRNIRDQDKWLYFCTEAGKQIPFKNKFKEVNVTNPLEFTVFLDAMIAGSDEVKGFKGIILDSLDFLMQQYESKFVINSKDSFKGWLQYGEFFRVLMQEKIAKLNKPAIFIAHNQEVFDEKNVGYKTSVVIKGSVKASSVEAYFNTILYSKKVKTGELANFGNGLLNVTEREKRKGFKYVFQTDVSSNAVDEKIRSPIDLWKEEELYIDNDCQVVLDRLTEYYKD